MNLTRIRDWGIGLLLAAALAACSPNGLFGGDQPQRAGIVAPSQTVFTVPAVTSSYVAGFTGLVAASSATDVFTITGSATGPMHVNRLCVGGRATAAANADVLLIKRSTADTGGTSTAPVEVRMDNNIPPTPSGVVLAAYTANPTLGTGTSTYLGARQVGIGNLTTATTNSTCWDFSNTPLISRPTLHGVTDQLAVNLGAATFSGNLLDVEITYTLN